MQPDRLTSAHRGTAENPPNRFEHVHPERDEDWDPEQEPLPRTQFFKDRTSTIIAYNDSPDVGFEASINPYRGCEHGCIYCYARPFHEYLGFSSGLDFETKIMVKEDAPKLLRKELSSPKWQPKVIALSGVTDCYQPIERRLKLTRSCLEVLAEFRNPAAIITKNVLVTRDIDLLSELARHEAVLVFISVTSLRGEFARELEPRASQPQRRLAAIEALAGAGIPVGVLVAPVIPGLTDHEMPSILAACAKAGALTAGYVPLRLPYGLAPLFEAGLSLHAPLEKDKGLHRIRDIRGGRMNDPNIKSRMQGERGYARQLRSMFELLCRRFGLDGPRPNLSTEAFRRPGEQMGLFR